MIREFAIDPQAVDNWKDFRHFVDQCGVEHGRLISEYPGKWKRRVYEAAANCGDIERARIEERLRAMGDKLVASGRPYDGSRDWLNNAEAQQHARPFHAIIARENPRRASCVHIADEIDENTLCWKHVRQKIVPRRAAALAEAAAPLFRISRELVLVDPHFKPTEPKWCRSLKALLTRAVQENPKMQRLEVHAESKLDAALWRSECQKELPGCVPKGFELRVVRWQRRDHGPKPHARYILTERGGLQVDYGLDDTGNGETTHVTLLDDAFCKQVWSEFGNDIPVFSLADEIAVKGVLAYS